MYIARFFHHFSVDGDVYCLSVLGGHGQFAWWRSFFSKRTCQGIPDIVLVLSQVCCSRRVSLILTSTCLDILTWELILYKHKYERWCMCQTGWMNPERNDAAYGSFTTLTWCARIHGVDFVLFCPSVCCERLVDFVLFCPSVCCERLEDVYNGTWPCVYLLCAYVTGTYVLAISKQRSVVSWYVYNGTWPCVYLLCAYVTGTYVLTISKQRRVVSWCSDDCWQKLCFGEYLIRHGLLSWLFSQVYCLAESPADLDTSCFPPPPPPSQPSKSFFSINSNNDACVEHVHIDFTKVTPPLLCI